jgi:translation initiation factor IF-3
MFRGREMSHSELGRKLLDRLADDVNEIAKIEAFPKLDGRNMTMVLSPLREAITNRHVYVPKQRGPRPEEPAEEVQEAEPQEEEKPRPPKVTRAEGG